MASGKITTLNKKLDGLLSHLLYTSQSITVTDPGVYLVIVKYFSDPGFNKSGIYLVTISAGAAEYSKVTIKEGSTPPALTVSSSGMVFTVDLEGAVEFSYINFIDFR